MPQWALIIYSATGLAFILAAVLDFWYERLKDKNTKFASALGDRQAGSAILFLALLAASIATFLTTHQEAIFSLISANWFIVPCVLAGPLLFRFRSRRPFAYGAVELVASWVIIFVAIYASNSSNATINSVSGLPLLGKITAILGGIYVSVRGFDNMDKRIPDRFRARWKSFFFGDRTAASSGA
jgi:hypothetical protein